MKYNDTMMPSERFGARARDDAQRAVRETVQRYWCSQAFHKKAKALLDRAERELDFETLEYFEANFDLNVAHRRARMERRMRRA